MITIAKFENDMIMIIHFFGKCNLLVYIFVAVSHNFTGAAQPEARYTHILRL
jgi:hypothetical protein